MLPVTDYPLASRGASTVLDTELVLAAVDVTRAFIRAKFGVALDEEAIALLAIALKTQAPTEIVYPKGQPAPFRSTMRLQISIRWPAKEGDDIVVLRDAPWQKGGQPEDVEMALLQAETRELNDRIYRACGWSHRRTAAE